MSHASNTFEPLGLSLSRAATSPRWLVDTFLVVSGALLVALLAQVKIPLGFTPVPITAQSLGVLVVGAGLGARLGAFSMGLYFILGMIGFPFYAGGSSGLEYAFGSTFGYLIGFVAAAYVVGLLAQRGHDRKVSSALIAFGAGHLCIFGAGLVWLSFFFGAEHAMKLGFVPFIPGLVIKTVIAALAIPGVWKAVQKIRS